MTMGTEWSHLLLFHFLLPTTTRILSLGLLMVKKIWNGRSCVAYISLFLCPHFQSKWLTVMILLKFWNVCVSRNGITIFLHRKSGLGWKSTALWAAHFLGTCFGGLSGLLLKADPLERRTCLAVWWEREKEWQTGRHAVSLLRMRQGSSRLHFET